MNEITAGSVACRKAGMTFNYWEVAMGPVNCLQIRHLKKRSRFLLQQGI